MLVAARSGGSTELARAVSSRYVVSGQAALTLARAGDRGLADHVGRGVVMTLRSGVSALEPSLERSARVPSRAEERMCACERSHEAAADPRVAISPRA